VKKEYEEKQKLKREKRKGKDKEKDKEKEKEAKGKEAEEDKQDEKAKDDKACIVHMYPPRLANFQCRLRNSPKPRIKLRLSLVRAYTNSTSGASSPNSLLKPDVLTLHRNFYQMRLDKLRNAEIAKRNRERLNNPANFPSVPSSNP
jgi:hypothetical protein